MKAPLAIDQSFSGVEPSKSLEQKPKGRPGKVLRSFVAAVALAGAGGVAEAQQYQYQYYNPNGGRQVPSVSTYTNQSGEHIVINPNGNSGLTKKVLRTEVGNLLLGASGIPVRLGLQNGHTVVDVNMTASQRMAKSLSTPESKFKSSFQAEAVQLLLDLKYGFVPGAIINTEDPSISITIGPRTTFLKAIKSKNADVVIFTILYTDESTQRQKIQHLTLGRTEDGRIIRPQKIKDVDDFASNEQIRALITER